MIGHRAREQVEAGLQADIQQCALARKRFRDLVDGLPADALQGEIVLVLSEVRELDSHLAGRDPDSGKPVVELNCHDLHAGEWGGGLGRHRADKGEPDEDEGQSLHRRSGTLANDPAFGTIGPASVPSHCSRTEQ
jgi:hypothetical protein